MPRAVSATNEGVEGSSASMATLFSVPANVLKSQARE